MMKTIFAAAALLVAATSASLAQVGYDGPYGPYGYNNAPSWSAPAHRRYYNNYGSGPSYYDRDDERGGPGPRVGAGSGMGIGSQR
jgi:hypothetical protein